LLFFVDLINNPGFAYFCFLLGALIEKQENQDYSLKLEQITTIRKKEKKKKRRKNGGAARPVYHTVHLFTRLLPCPGLQLNARSNSTKFDVGPMTL
jgi:hypothetical protein